MPYKDGVGATLNRIGGEAAYRFRGGPLGNRPYRGRRGDLWWVTDGAAERLTVWSDIANAWVTGTLADGDYGDVTISGGGTVITIDNNVVNNLKLADMPTLTIKGRNDPGTGDPEDLTATEVTAMLDSFVGDTGAGGTKGLVPAPPVGSSADDKFLHADGTFRVPVGVVIPFEEDVSAQADGANTMFVLANFVSPDRFDMFVNGDLAVISSTNGLTADDDFDEATLASAPLLGDLVYAKGYLSASA